MPTTTNKKKVYDAIWRKLIIGELEPGVRLSEAILAKELGVSRTPVREALNQLCRDGLVDSIPNTGTYVRKLSRDEVAELLELRELLEIYAVRRAAQRITEAQLSELRTTCQAMESVVNEVISSNLKTLEGALAARWQVTEVLFHAALVDSSSANPVSPISRLTRDFHILLNLCMRPPRDQAVKLKDRLTRAVREHRGIIEALAEHDANKAVHLLRAHIQFGTKHTLKTYDAEQPADSSAEQYETSALEKVLRY